MRRSVRRSPARTQLLPKAACSPGVPRPAGEPVQCQWSRGTPPPHAPRGAARRSTGRDRLRVRARPVIFGLPGALSQYPVDRVLAVVIDKAAVLVPVSPARTPRNLLRPDHYVVDAIPAHQVEGRRVPLEDQ